tara:strand:+ start:883 stop:1110 length:228 start_codon:yes stop_codon:yes gene_type:complete
LNYFDARPRSNDINIGWATLIWCPRQFGWIDHGSKVIRDRNTAVRYAQRANALLDQMAQRDENFTNIIFRGRKNG